MTKKTTKAKTKRRLRTAMKGISRIDSKSTHGWYVRCYKGGKVYAKLFSDSKFGGKIRGLATAKRHRDREKILLEDLEPGECLIYRDSFKFPPGLIPVTKKVGGE